MECKEAELFKVLGVESRIRIIELLKQQGPLGVNKMSKALGITPAAVSQHLKLLRLTGLVRSERKGHWVPYEIDHPALERCRGLLSKVCTCGCEGSRHIHKPELRSAKDNLVLLKKYERELRKELKEVCSRIRTLEKNA